MSRKYSSYSSSFDGSTSGFLPVHMLSSGGKVPPENGTQESELTQTGLKTSIAGGKSSAITMSPHFQKTHGGKYGRDCSRRKRGDNEPSARKSTVYNRKFDDLELDSTLLAYRRYPFANLGPRGEDFARTLVPEACVQKPLFCFGRAAS